ncbi:MAG: polysaccharide biosynthesis/export family protein [Sedimentisphaerales bacterium]|nr:polysaccharide biosynthesis/export family protein [Sedimentisphaerales bacterium]
MKYAQTITVVALLLAGAVLSGCGCSICNPADIEAFLKPYEAEVTAKNYILRPPDDIAIHCAKVPEINLQVQRIRPDGKVSFEGLGEFEAAGKTPAQLAEVLKVKVAELYNLIGEHPIEVRVVGFRSKVYYVMGQVNMPGAQIHTGRETVLLSVAEAGPNPMAAESKIRVIRPSHDPNVKPKAFKVNFNDMIKKGDVSQDVLLEEGDIVYVPPTILASIALKIEEAIRPLARAFSGAYMMQNPPTSRKGSYGGSSNPYRGY